MRIKEVRLIRFRQFKDTTFHFGDVNVLAGANNSGKTSVLWAIKTFYYFAKKALAVRNNEIDFHKHYVHAKDFMPIPNDDELWYKRDDRQTVPVRISITYENGWQGTLVLTARFGQIHVSFNSGPLPRGITPRQIADSLSKEVAFVPGLVGVLVQEAYSSPARQASLASEGRYPEIFRSSLIHLKERRPAGLRALNEFLEQVFGIELKSPSYDPHKDEYIMAKYREGGKEFDIVDCGSGVQQIVQLFTYLYLTSPAVILFDEPDAHLHPSVQAGLAAALSRIQTDLHAQLLVATHSYDIIDYFPRNHVVLVDSSKQINQGLQTDQEKIDKLTEIGIIANSALVRLYSSAKCVILEDSYSDIFKGFDRVLKTKVTERSAIRSAKGISKFGVQKDVIESISSIIQHPISPFFLQDTDGLPDAWLQEMKALAVREGLNIIFLGRHEMENFLLDPSLLRKALKRKGRDVSLQDIKRLLLDTAEANRYEWHEGIRRMAKSANHKLSGLPNRPAKTDEAVITEIDAHLNQVPLTLEFVLKTYPGKELLKKVRREIQARYNISLSNEDIFSVADKRTSREFLEILRGF
jgi:ABC-type cobalamin/Fe3+-siderophores transport system ATPase subunit